MKVPQRTSTMNLSWVALGLSVLATFPQLSSVLTTGLVRDHNATTLLLGLLANSVLALHGYLRKDIGLFFLGLWFALYNAVLSYHKVRGNQQPDKKD